MPLLGEGADASLRLNFVGIGGNFDNYPADEMERLEQWQAIDDVRIFAVQSD